MIQAKVIADSKNQFGNRITTLVVTMPRYILAEFNTHRMLSKNSASSRAIPFEKMLTSVEETPFIPIAFQKDHKGMQGTEYFEEVEQNMLKQCWLVGRDRAVQSARELAWGIGVRNGDKVTNTEVTKQMVNRQIEAYIYHTVIVTATEWMNFFALRCPKYTSAHGEEWMSRKDYMKDIQEPDMIPKSEIGWLSINKGMADIHMMATAEAIYDAMNESTPKELKEGEWHIPFGDDITDDLLFELLNGREEFDQFYNSPINTKIKIATARCARVSYTVVGQEGKQHDFVSDIKLHDRLATSGHWSPFEHCAQVPTIKQIQHQSSRILTDIKKEGETYVEAIHLAGWYGNFRGFIQYRKTFQNENITK